MPNSYQALFFDLSGVIYEGKQIIPNAPQIIEQARQQGILLRFVTNTATQSSQDIIAKLQCMQIFIAPEELFTAPIAAQHYIQRQKLRPLCIIHKSIQADFAHINQDNPNCVVLGDAREELHYTILNKAFQLCKQGAPLMGIGLNKYFKNESGLQLDAGAFIQGIAWAADIQPIIIGKPSQDFFAEIVASTPFEAHQCLMIGDDVISDVKGAIDSGLQACLVKTGKYLPEDLEKLPKSASIIESIADLFKL